VFRTLNYLPYAKDLVCNNEPLKDVM
jgi:hypothetical protein